MFFPIGDTQVTGGYKPIVSYSFIGINVLVFLFQVFSPGNLICEFAAVPIHILQGEKTHTLVTSLFLHGSWMHLIGNMLFLWVFADNIEAKVGNISFFIFYITGGIFASAAHIYFSARGVNLEMITCELCFTTSPCEGEINPHEAVIPSLGASGSISAVMGAYLLMFPASKVKVLILLFFRSFYVPAFLFLILWFGQQLISGIGSLHMATSGSEGVAWWAHIGGFVFGLAAGLYFLPQLRSENDFD
ncbi:MAG: rhomboid family intramembrane serine protease [Saprospiraceae bacterium]|nr:rhomboid family intramembrane serine protease [Saprospiraceae bacterium]